MQGKLKTIFLNIQHFFKTPYFPILMGILAVGIMLPDINQGLMFDDLIHRYKLVDSDQIGQEILNSGWASPKSGEMETALFDLFSFIRPDVNLTQLKQSGYVPWWTYEGLRISFWRPITGFTHWLDYNLFPDNPLLMHAHNLLWFACAIILAALFYRKLMIPAWIASLAALLYAIDDSFFYPAVYIANRNALLALTFALICLFAHHHWRQQKALWAAFAAPAALLLSVFSAEAGIAACAYLFAYEVTITQGKWQYRLLHLLPYVAIILIWRGVYNHLGYGTFGSDFYCDPGREPGRYLINTFKHAPIMLMGQFGWQPAELHILLSRNAKIINWFVSMAFLCTAGYIIWPLIRRQHIARFWTVGMLFALLPICASSPMNRNLYFVSIGAMGLTAMFIAAVIEKKDWVITTRFRRISAYILCGLFLFIHIVGAIGGRIKNSVLLNLAMNKINTTLPFEPEHPVLGKDLVIINAPSPHFFALMPFIAGNQGHDLPQAVRILAPGFTGFQLTRTNEKTVSMRALSGTLLTCDQTKDVLLHPIYFYKHFDGVVRAEDLPMKKGDIFSLPRMTIEIAEVNEEGHPIEAHFHFITPLEDASLAWRYWNWDMDRYETFTLPAHGETTTINGPLDS